MCDVGVAVGICYEGSLSENYQSIIQSSIRKSQSSQLMWEQTILTVS
jgi:hypothetical protein